MSEIEDRLRTIQKRHSEAVAAKTRAEIEAENATKSLLEARQALKDEFGVSTTEELQSERERLSQELVAALDEVDRLLTEAGA